MNTTVDDASIPAGAAALGVVGVAPFALCAFSVWWFGDQPLAAEAERALAAYGAVVLSFVGGVRLGAAFTPQSRDQAAPEFVLAVIPVLLAWCALLLPGRAQPLLALMLAFAVFGILDVREGARGLWPRWYSRLRLIATVLILLCLGVALIT